MTTSNIRSIISITTTSTHGACPPPLAHVVTSGTSSTCRTTSDISSTCRMSPATCTTPSEYVACPPVLLPHMARHSPPLTYSIRLTEQVLAQLSTACRRSSGAAAACFSASALLNSGMPSRSSSAVLRACPLPTVSGNGITLRGNLWVTPGVLRRGKTAGNTSCLRLDASNFFSLLFLSSL